MGWWTAHLAGAVDMEGPVRARLWRPRLVWAVVFLSDAGDVPFMVGGGWAGQHPPRWEGEPSQPLLFASRAAARTWCRAKRAQYAGRADSCRTWQFRTVRVRESWVLA